MKDWFRPGVCVQVVNSESPFYQCISKVEGLEVGTEQVLHRMFGSIWFQFDELEVWTED